MALVSSRQILPLNATLSYCKISSNNDKQDFQLTVLAQKSFAVALSRYL